MALGGFVGDLPCKATIASASPRNDFAFEVAPGLMLCLRLGFWGLRVVKARPADMPLYFRAVVVLVSRALVATCTLVASFQIKYLSLGRVGKILNSILLPGKNILIAVSISSIKSILKDLLLKYQSSSLLL